MTNLRRRAALILFGLMIFPIGPELLLRAASRIYWTWRTDNSSRGAEPLTILCLGDSFTFGLGADQGMDYPRQFERLLNQRGIRAQVVNAGIPNQRSFNVDKELSANLDSIRPDLVLLLIGFNDLEYFGPEKFDVSVRMSARLSTSDFSRHDFLGPLRRLRLYQAAAYAWDRWLTHPGRWYRRQPEPPRPQRSDLPPAIKTQELLGQAQRAFGVREFDKAARLYKTAWRREKSEEALFGLLDVLTYPLYNRPQEAREWFKTAADLGIQNARLYDMLGQYNRNNATPDAALASYQKAAALDPYDVGAYSQMADIYSFNKNDFRHARETLDKLHEFYDGHLDILYNELMTDHWLDGKEIAQRLEGNLAAIAQTCRTRGIPLVLLTYPYPRGVEPAIFNISRSWGVPVIDNAPAFAKLLENEPPLKYFTLDTGGVWQVSHLNSLGYGVMAENILRELSARDLLRPRLSGAAR